MTFFSILGRFKKNYRKFSKFFENLGIIIFYPIKGNTKIAISGSMTFHNVYGPYIMGVVYSLFTCDVTMTSFYMKNICRANSNNSKIAFSNFTLCRHTKHLQGWYSKNLKKISIKFKKQDI